MWDWWYRYVCRCPRYRLIPIVGPFVEQRGRLPVRVTRHATFPRGETLMATTMTDSQVTTLSLTLADKKGNPTGPLPAGASVSWLVDNPNVLAVTPSADTLTCSAAAVGPLGAATVTVKVALPDGSNATGSIDFTIVAGAPTSISVTASPPVEQP